MDAIEYDIEASIRKTDVITSHIPAGLLADVHSMLDLGCGYGLALGIGEAIIVAPGILILDEATSALGHVSEQRITQMLLELQKSGHFTIIVIAHRYTTIQHADRIYEIRNGSAKLLGGWEDGRMGGCQSILGARVP